MKRTIIVLASLALILAGCELYDDDDDYLDYDPDTPTGGPDDPGGSNDLVGLKNTCYATHVGICVEYDWDTTSAYEDAKSVCQGDTRNVYKVGASCPLPAAGESRVGCKHEGATGDSMTWTYFGPDGRNAYLIDTVEGVKAKCWETGGTVWVDS